MKYKEIQKLSKNEKEKKLKELRLELVKSKVASSKGSGSSKTKEIKKIIARILTLNNSENQGFSGSRNQTVSKHRKPNEISSAKENKFEKLNKK